MKFAIQINCSPNQTNASHTAFQFVKTTLHLGHEVIRVFFYHDGVYHAFAHALPPADEWQYTSSWQQLVQMYALDLVVCISAAQRRGLLCADEAKLRHKTDDDLAQGFRISGLGQLVEASLLADRFIVFG